MLDASVLATFRALGGPENENKLRLYPGDRDVPAQMGQHDAAFHERGVLIEAGAVLHVAHCGPRCYWAAAERITSTSLPAATVRPDRCGHRGPALQVVDEGADRLAQLPAGDLAEEGDRRTGLLQLTQRRNTAGLG
ncbi:hypothetical protein J7E90_31410 [Streptomyces sp. ISL-111]|uniref:hypothetical protein n=1 Tax=Streptomyces sp. ISL-111 TaxID=2819175 RepID=UPI001BE7FDA9|nr:hypothetical protein [Streptomyces sp. ISL-111]MBT2381678.1 hypothetical protein [Streptomyces sp. ISL-111]